MVHAARCKYRTQESSKICHLGTVAQFCRAISLQLPCSLLKSCADVFTPVITRLANLSLQTSRFPSQFKRAQVLPLLKKAGLDSSSPANYRPISSLATVSKILERLVLSCLRPHLLGSPNFNQYQSAYRTGHSTETALLEVLDVSTRRPTTSRSPCSSV